LSFYIADESHYTDDFEKQEESHDQVIAVPMVEMKVSKEDKIDGSKSEPNGKN
jgi:hypothetical protein